MSDNSHKSEMGLFWQEEREKKKAIEKDKCETAMYQALKWRVDNEDVIITKVQEWQIRFKLKKITIDIYPIHSKYHRIDGNKRGVYRSLTKLLTDTFKKEK